MIRRPPRSPLFPYPPLSRSPAMPAPTPGPGGPADVDFMKMASAALPAEVGTEEERERAQLPTPPEEDSQRSEEHTSELQSRLHLVCRLLLEKKKINVDQRHV